MRWIMASFTNASDDMPLAAVHTLGVVPAPLLAAGGRVHRLAVHAGGGARRVGLRRGADLAAQGVVDGVEGAVVAPLVEVAPHGRFGGEVLGQVAPLAAGPQDVEDGIDDVAQVGLARPSARVDGDEGLDQGPLRVGDVARVGLRSHGALYAPGHPLWDSH